MTPARRRRKLPKRTDPPKPAAARRRKSTVITAPPTKAERYAAGHRNTCDICKVKIGTKKRGKRVEIWSFTVKGANGKVFNRCRLHLKVKAGK
jgi:hypothetical protein